MADLEAIEQGVEGPLRALRLAGRHLEGELDEVRAVGQGPLLDAELVREGFGRELPLARLDRAEHGELVERDVARDARLLRLAEQLAQLRHPVRDLLDLAAIGLPVELGRGDLPGADHVELDPDALGRAPGSGDPGQRERPQLDRRVVIVALRHAGAQHEIPGEQLELRGVVEVHPAPRGIDPARAAPRAPSAPPPAGR